MLEDVSWCGGSGGRSYVLECECEIGGELGGGGCLEGAAEKSRVVVACYVRISSWKSSS